MNAEKTTDINPSSSYRPQDDLFRAVNHEWLETHEIPADRPTDGVFYHLRDTALEQVREIVESLPEPESEEDQQIRDFYAAFMDTATIEDRGWEPLKDFFARINAADTVDDLIILSGSFNKMGIPGLIGTYVATDSKDITHYALHFSQSGLSLPDESYYKDEQFDPIRQAYIQHITQMFTLIASEEPALIAKNVMKVETALAQHHWNRVDRRDADKTYNKFVWEDFIQLSPRVPLAAWAQSSGIHPTPAHVIVVEPSFISSLSQVAESISIPEWKSWLSWKVLTFFAPFLSDAFVQENFHFYGTVLNGTTQIKDRWKRGIYLLESALGFAVGKKYTAKHFPQDAKAAISELVDNLIQAYHHSISHLDWMSEDTKAKALIKLSQFTPKIGYPQVWKTYEGLSISPHDVIGNIIRCAQYETTREINRIGTEVDRQEWLMTPQTVNAYYYPEQNEIVFPAAILQPPFFDPEGDIAANYGGIGAVIGHEIGHGFDDQGAKYDGTGALKDWWSEQDKQEFTARTQKLIEQYNSYTLADLPGQHVNGALTIGENIGDLGGLSIAILAFSIAQGRDLTTEELQRVFHSWAIIWRAKARKEYQEILLTVDPHSPAEFRCNGVVRNIDAFYSAYNVQPSDALYLAPEQRVRIW